MEKCVKPSDLTVEELRKRLIKHGFPVEKVNDWNKEKLVQAYAMFSVSQVINCLAEQFKKNEAVDKVTTKKEE